MTMGSTQALTEMSTRNISWGQRRQLPRAENLTIFMCRLYRYVGVSTSWNAEGLSRPVQELLYLSLYIHKHRFHLASYSQPVNYVLFKSILT